MAWADDVFDLAAAMYGEARSEGRKGRVAIGHTIVNRARAAGVGIGATVYGRSQYTAVSPRDRNRAEIAEAARKNTPAWQETVREAVDVLSGKAPDPTLGATHYYADTIAPPKWAKTFERQGKRTAEIGAHRFYRDPVEARAIVRAAARNPVAPISRTPAMLSSMPAATPVVNGDERLADGWGYQDPNAFAGLTTPDSVPAPTARRDALNGNAVAGRSAQPAYERARLDGLPTPTPRSSVAGRGGVPAPTFASLPDSVADRMQADRPAAVVAPAEATAYAPAPGRTRMGAAAAIDRAIEPGRAPGLAGITSASQGRALSSYDRSKLSPGIAGVMDALDNAGFGGAGINSGHRTRAHNRAVGGASRSQHLDGDAIDVDVRGWSNDQKAAMLEAAVNGGARGVGLYSSGNAIHLDHRESPAVWGAGGSYTGMTIDRAPAWARPSLNAMFSGAPVAPRQGPMPRSPNLPADVQARLEAPAMPALTRTAAPAPTMTQRAAGLLGEAGRFANSMLGVGSAQAASYLTGDFTPLNPVADVAPVPTPAPRQAAARPAPPVRPTYAEAAARTAPQLAAPAVPDLTSRSLPGAAPSLPTRNLPGFPTPSSPAPVSRPGIPTFGGPFSSLAAAQPQAPVGPAGEQKIETAVTPKGARVGGLGGLGGYPAPRQYGPNLPAATPAVAASLPALSAPRDVGPAPRAADLSTPRTPAPAILTTRPSTNRPAAPGVGAPSVPAAPRQLNAVERFGRRVGNALPSAEQAIGGVVGAAALGPVGLLGGSYLGREIDRRSTLASQGYDPTARMSGLAQNAMDAGWGGFGPVVADPEAAMVAEQAQRRNSTMRNVAIGAVLGGAAFGPVGLLGGGILGGSVASQPTRIGALGNGVSTGLITGRAIPQSVLADPARYGRGGFTGLGLPSTPKTPSQSKGLKDRDRRGGRDDSGPSMSKSASDAIGKAGAGRGGLY